MKRTIFTETVSHDHAYTREDVPWEMSERRLMRAHGRTVKEERDFRRQRRFAVLMVIFWTCWCVAYFW